MHTLRAKRLANYYIKQHLSSDWCFMWDLSYKHFASTQFNKKVITLSKPFVLRNSEQAVRDAILHEIAHAMLPAKNKHDSDWQLACIALGGNGRAYLDATIKKPLLIQG